MLGRKGLYNAQAVLDEIAREILYFSAAAGGVPEAGIDLKVNLLARMTTSTPDEARSRLTHEIPDSANCIAPCITSKHS